MKNLKLEDRISANYALLFLVLILVSNIILVYSLKRQSNKMLEKSADDKIEEINSFLDKVGIFSDKTNVLTLDFNPEIVEGKKIIHVKPFNPGEDNYLYVLEIEQKNDSIIPINTVGDTDTEEATITNEKMETNINGVFCAGDVRDKPLRQVATAVSDGAVAAYYAEKYMSESE